MALFKKITAKIERRIVDVEKKEKKTIDDVFPEAVSEPEEEASNEESDSAQQEDQV